MNIYKDTFSNEEKIKAFDQIAEMYYNRNFGTASKAEIDLLMFKFYYEAAISKSRNEESGVIDYRACSDYKIGKQLGLTEQRVRNLKRRKELVYPSEDFDWVKELAHLLSDEKCVNIENGSVIISIPDPNLYAAIEDFISDKGGYLNYHLNSKVLDIKIEYLTALAVEFEDEETKKKIVKEVSKHKRITGIKKLGAVLSGSLNITSNVVGILSGENLFKSALESILGGIINE